jgi:hypothetical protein
MHTLHETNNNNATHTTTSDTLARAQRNTNAHSVRTIFPITPNTPTTTPSALGVSHKVPLSSPIDASSIVANTKTETNQRRS